MIPMQKGRHRTRIAVTADDIRACQRLRARAFGLKCEIDGDLFDTTCTHVMIEETSSARLVGCYRMLDLGAGAIAQSYSAQYYELSALRAYRGRMVELGRFCIDPDQSDRDILRLAWASITAYVIDADIRLLFGCSSFAGTQTDRYLDAFALLNDRHLAPKRWLPRVKAPDVFRFAAGQRRRPNLQNATRAMPPLLRSYLSMGGWVSDHAVVDRQLNTLHVFTGVEIATIPPARQRVLRALA